MYFICMRECSAQHSSWLKPYFNVEPQTDINKFIIFDRFAIDTFSFIFIQWIFVLNLNGVKCLVFYFRALKKLCLVVCIQKSWPFQILNRFREKKFWHKFSTNWHRLCFDIIFLTLQIRNNDVFLFKNLFREKKTRWFSFYYQKPWITADEMHLQMNFSEFFFQYCCNIIPVSMHWLVYYGQNDTFPLIV